MVEVLAFQFNHFFQVLDSELADGAHLCIFLVVVDRFFHLFTAVNFVKRYVFISLLYLLEDPSVLVEPFFSSVSAHHVRAQHCVTGHVAPTPIG